MQNPDEIVYEETRPGVMETKREIYEREERTYRRWDRMGPWMLPIGAGAFLAIQALAQWLT